MAQDVPCSYNLPHANTGMPRFAGLEVSYIAFFMREYFANKNSNFVRSNGVAGIGLLVPTTPLASAIGRAIRLKQK